MVFRFHVVSESHLEFQHWSKAIHKTNKNEKYCNWITALMESKSFRLLDDKTTGNNSVKSSLLTTDSILWSVFSFCVILTHTFLCWHIGQAEFKKTKHFRSFFHPYYMFSTKFFLLMCLLVHNSFELHVGNTAWILGKLGTKFGTNTWKQFAVQNGVIFNLLQRESTLYYPSSIKFIPPNFGALIPRYCNN